MALIADGDLLEAKLLFKSDRDGALNVRHFRAVIQGAGGTFTHAQAAQAIKTQYGPFYAPMMASVARLVFVTVQRLSPLPKTDAEFSNDVPVSGTSGSDMLPRQTCGLLSLRTGVSGRKNRGRMYIPYPSEAMNTDQAFPTAAYVTLLTAMGTNVLDDVDIGTPTAGFILQPIIYHRATNTATSIISTIAREDWATQRRRNNNKF